MRRGAHVPVHAISLRERRVFPSDAAEIARMMREDLPVPSRLATALASLLQNLLATERLAGRCVEAASAARASSVERKLAAFGLSGFLADDCADAWVERPTPGFALEMLERCRRDASGSGLLDADGIAQANSGEGLHLFPFCWLQRPSDTSTPLGAELLAQGMRAFLTQHVGYNLKRILKEAAPEQESVLTRGGLVRLKSFPGGPAAPGEHLLFGLAREQARGEARGSALSLLFSTPPPRLGFTRIQQHVLLGAVDDLSDEEIAGHLNVSTHAVNMRWRTIYERMLQDANVAASVFDRREASAARAATAQKRRRVTAFVRAHPEELRPYA